MRTIAGIAVILFMLIVVIPLTGCTEMLDSLLTREDLIRKEEGKSVDNDIVFPDRSTVKTPIEVLNSTPSRLTTTIQKDITVNIDADINLFEANMGVELLLAEGVSCFSDELVMYLLEVSKAREPSEETVYKLGGKEYKKTVYSRNKKEITFYGSGGMEYVSDTGFKYKRSIPPSEEEMDKSKMSDDMALEIVHNFLLETGIGDPDDTLFAINVCTDDKGKVVYELIFTHGLGSLPIACFTGGEMQGADSLGEGIIAVVGQKGLMQLKVFKRQKIDALDDDFTIIPLEECLDELRGLMVLDGDPAYVINNINLVYKAMKYEQQGNRVKLIPCWEFVTDDKRKAFHVDAALLR